MRKVFDIDTVMDMFVLQTTNEAMTPLCDIRGRGKARRFYFKGDTAYSYGNHFPLARMDGDKMYIKDKAPSRTTRKHMNRLVAYAKSYSKEVIFSNDLQTPRMLDETIELYLKKFLNAKSRSKFYAKYVIAIFSKDTELITKSKFPLLFEEEHQKLRTMMVSEDKEIIDLAKKIIRKQKLI